MLLACCQGISLTTLPYSYDALAPYISKRTVEIHHSKHHQKYVTTANELVKGTDLEGKDVIRFGLITRNKQWECRKQLLMPI